MATLNGAWALTWSCLFLYFLAQMPPETQGICYFHAQAPCLYKGKLFAPGESWRDANCSKCFCLEPLGVGCCDTMQFPVDFPDGCEAHYDSLACRVFLVQKGRPGVPCAKTLEPGWASGHLPEQTHKQLLPSQPHDKRGPKTPSGR
ncbi:prostate-associated microseminoprotein [Sceloporus undulatus]|uniref:prostate-associated microseminoprotein n=1 Tax=Sceloporus undulatus TaxID=8520 RepID=UPI001C4B1325|nr:prostate-associated microseminoprotein [Sceloporus undulatus]